MLCSQKVTCFLMLPIIDCWGAIPETIWGLDLLWLGFPKLLMAIFVSSYTGDHTGRTGHVGCTGRNGCPRDKLNRKLSTVSQQNVQLRWNFRQGTPQLLEVHTCFIAVGIPIGCKWLFDNCGGRNRFLTIYFPDVNTLPNQCIFFFMSFLSLFVSLKFIFYFGINFLILFMFLLCSYISHEEL